MRPGHMRAVVIGAGPVGLDAALAAVHAGMSVIVLEAGDSVATNVRDWGHVRLFTPWDMLVSSRMAAALERDGLPMPDGPPPSGAEFVGAVLEPVARGTVLAGRVRYGSRVVSVGRAGLLKHEEIGSGARGRRPFRILVQGPAGEEWVEEADLVLDCSGTWGNPNPLGPGGIPALGERGCAAISHRIPDVDRDRGLRGLRVLVVGGGHSAMTAVRDLGRLARADRSTRVFWVTRGPEARLPADPNDPLPLRRDLLEDVAALLVGEGPPVEHLGGFQVEAVRDVEDGVRVTLTSAVPGARGRGAAEDPRELVVDRIHALTGSVGDRELYRQLQVHECYATQGPMKLAAALLAADAGADCLDQVSHGAAALANPEPDFYILGSKSYGRNNTFLLKIGFDQVSEVFASLDEGDGVAA